MDNTISRSHKDGRLFFFTVLYLIIEYARPMDLIPGLDLLHPGLIVSIILLIALFKNKNIGQAWSKQTKYLLLFLILLAIYVPFAVNNRYSFEVTKTIFLYMIFFCSAVLYINSFERLRSFFSVWMFIMIFLALRGIVGKGIGGSSFLHDENDFSLLMNVMLPFAIFLFMYESSLKRKVLYITSAVLSIVSIVISFSRGGFVGLLVVLIIVWLCSPRKIMTLTIVSLLTLVILNVAGDSYWARIDSITATDQGTARERMDSWNAGWNMFLDNPMGVGGGNFPVRFPEYQPADMPHGMYGRAAHSFWFTLISETGIPGIILFILLIVANFHDINFIRKVKDKNDSDVKFARYLSLAFIASFCGFFASGTFITVNYYPHFYYLTAMVVVTRRVVDIRISARPLAL